ncbi:MAG: AzlC family ABC transporter permease [Actinomycetaceae bacterium]|nr:AzlC family ABC transporter permease [Actinomycetaceae bacterium]
MSRSDLALTLRDTWIVGAGYIPLGLAFGMYAVSLGIPWWWIPIFSITLYAGSMQFVAAQLITGGAGFLTIAITTFFVNFRHVFYGISFPLRRMKHPLARAYGIHALTDETYALLSTRDPNTLSGRRVFFTELINHLYWISGTTVGALIVHWAHFDATFMSFALTSLFIVLAIDAYRANPRPFIVVAAFACAAVGLVVGQKLMLIVSLVSFTVVVVLWVLRTAAHVNPDDASDSSENFLPYSTEDMP